MKKKKGRAEVDSLENDVFGNGGELEEDREFMEGEGEDFYDKGEGGENEVVYHKGKGGKMRKKWNGKASQMSDKEKAAVEILGLRTLDRKKVYYTIMEYLRRYKRMPSTAEISEIVEISERNVVRIMENIRFNNFNHPLRVMTDDVLAAIVATAKSGSVEGQKLFMQIFHGYSPRDGMPTTGEGGFAQLLKELKDNGSGGKKSLDYDMEVYKGLLEEKNDVADKEKGE